MDVLCITKKDRTIKGEITLPLSKSISNRVLIIHALAGFSIPSKDVSEADDTQLLIKLLEQIRLIRQSDSEVFLDCDNAGTVFRFLTAYLANKPGKWLLSGSSRMKERPVGTLVEALWQLGAQIQYQEKEGFPPLMIQGKKLNGGEVFLDTDISSQFSSALLLIAPAIQGGLKIRLKRPVRSRPYIKMTLGVLQHYGIEYTHHNELIHIPEQNFEPNKTLNEHDWSAASFWYAASALADSSNLMLKGLKQESLQGDAVLPEIFSSLGVHTHFGESGLNLSNRSFKPNPFMFDFTDYPDLFLPVVVTCAGLKIPFRVSGLENLQYKETDRLFALRSELEKNGVVTFPEKDSSLSYAMTSEEKEMQPKNSPNRVSFSTYNDHRMAMAFAVLAVRYGYAEIENPVVVVKSYPGFWNDMERMGFLLSSKRR